MRELRLLGLSEDRSHVLLTGPETGTVALPVDDRLRAAVLGDSGRLQQMEAKVESALSPREIQARLRAGVPAHDVAAVAGVPVEKVRRFEGPVRDERLHVVEAARAAIPRRDGWIGATPLGDTVDERLTADDVDLETVAWDSWRREDGSWLVQVRFHTASGTQTAHWTWDTLRRQATVADATAAELLGSDSAEDDLLGLAVAVTGPRPVLEGEPRPGALTLVREPDAAVDLADEAGAEAASAEAVLPLADETAETEPMSTEAQPSDRRTGDTDRQAEADGVEPGRRATVPSWDEILFGTRPPEQR